MRIREQMPGELVGNCAVVSESFIGSTVSPRHHLLPINELLPRALKHKSKHLLCLTAILLLTGYYHICCLSCLCTLCICVSVCTFLTMGGIIDARMQHFKCTFDSDYDHLRGKVLLCFMF